MFSTEDYLKRIGWPEKDPIEHNLDTLNKLQRLHSTSIPFDNFDFHLGTLISVDPTFVWNKIKNSTRGTYCFQGNYLFLTAIQKLGFSDAILIPVKSWRPRMNDFTQLPSHCCVIVPLAGQWVLIDVSTVDCLDGLLILSDKLDTPQSLRNGVRYQFNLVEDKEPDYSEEIKGKIRAVDPEYLKSSCVSIALLKEEVKRDDTTQDPFEPFEYIWENRFAFRLPKKKPEDINRVPISYLPDIISLPPSLPHKIAEILLEYAVIKDPRSHHYKQWVGIRYSADCQYKYILAGFRFIVVKRPYSKRNLTWCGLPPQREHNNNGNVPENAVAEVIQHLKDDIGVKLSEEEIKCLKLKEIYFMPNIDHVWSY